MYSAWIGRIEEVAAFFALISGTTAGYCAIFPPATQRQHHAALTSVVAWAASSPWLKAMQSAVQQALNVISVIYGPPNQSARSRLSHYLTRRAWRTSAWIASFYVLALGPIAVAGILFKQALFGDSRLGKLEDMLRTNPHHVTPIPPELLYTAAAFILVFGVISLAIHLHFLRRIRVQNILSSPAQTISNLFRDAVILLGMVVTFFAVLGLMNVFLDQRSFLPEAARSILLVILFAAAFSAIVGMLLRAIARYGFFAPLALVAQLALATVATWQIGVGIAIVPVVLFGSKSQGVPALTSSEPQVWLGLAAFEVASAATVIFCILAFARKQLRRKDYAFLGTAILSYFLFSILTGVPIVTLNDPSNSPITTVCLTLLYVAPPLIIFYGVIFAGSFPDWIAVGLTRYIFGSAVGVSSNLRFLGWLLASIACAGLCLILSSLIVSAAILSSAATGSALNDAISPASAASATHGLRFSLDDFLLLRLIGSLVATGPVGAWRTAVGYWRDTSDFATVFFKITLVLSTIGVTALLPTILNAFALIVLIAGRTAALVVVRPLRWIHQILLIPDTASGEEAAFRYSRGTQIIGAFGATVIAIAIWFLVSL